MRNNKYYIGQCKICSGYGELIVIYNTYQSKCSVMCDECLAEWNCPNDALCNINGYRKKYIKREARNATMSEICSVGWEKYIIGMI